MDTWHLDGDSLSAYWRAVDAQLRDVPARGTFDPIPSSSRDSFTVYAARFTSIGPYRVSAYLSVPTGDGPFPGILETPRYGSVNHVPNYNDRLRYIVLTPMHRGQRLSDEPFAAAYPGLLTQGIEKPTSYVYRGIVGDCLRAAEVLAGHPKVDTGKLGVVGDDLAFLTAARRPRFAAARIRDLLFYRAMEACGRTDDYPLEELNDYLRAWPGAATAVGHTLTLFDPLHHAADVRARTLLVGDDHPQANDVPWLGALMDVLGQRAEHYQITHEGGTDNDYLDRWLATQLRTQPMSRFRRELV